MLFLQLTKMAMENTTFAFESERHTYIHIYFFLKSKGKRKRKRMSQYLFFLCLSSLNLPLQATRSNPFKKYTLYLQESTARSAFSGLKVKTNAFALHDFLSQPFAFIFTLAAMRAAGGVCVPGLTDQLKKKPKPLRTQFEFFML